MKEIIKTVLAGIGAIAVLIVPIIIWGDSAVAMVRLNGAYSAIILFFIGLALNKENE